jgi:hypothetical protein
MLSKLFEFFFHNHTFDGTKWVLVAECSIHQTLLGGGSEELPYRRELVYTNTCLTCGDLISREINVEA